MENEIDFLKKRIIELEKENENLKRQKLEVNKAKELYLKIFEDFPALIWRSRLDKLCDYFNKTWLEFTGRTMEQEFGNGWAEGVHPEDFDFCLNTYVNAFDKREPFLMHYRMKDKHGEYRWIRDYGRPFYDIDNTFLGYIGSCYDVTDNINNEKQLEELIATKDKLFSILAHDLKNIFNTLLGFSSLINENYSNYSNEQVQKWINLIFETSNEGFKLLDNLLTWAKLQKGNIVSVPVKICVSEVLSEIEHLCQPMTISKEIKLEVEYNCNIQLYIDKEMIKFILRNLVSNAIKFSNKNGIVNVKTHIENDNIIFIVSDNGIGIESKDFDKLFKINTISKLGTAGEKGTGIGLLLCKEFIDKSGGKIWAESKLGIGADFKFSLPI